MDDNVEISAVVDDSLQIDRIVRALRAQGIPGGRISVIDGTGASPEDAARIDRRERRRGAIAGAAIGLTLAVPLCGILVVLLQPVLAWILIATLLIGGVGAGAAVGRSALPRTKSRLLALPQASTPADLSGECSLIVVTPSAEEARAARQVLGSNRHSRLL